MFTYHASLLHLIGKRKCWLSVVHCHIYVYLGHARCSATRKTWKGVATSMNTILVASPLYSNIMLHSCTSPSQRTNSVQLKDNSHWRFLVQEGSQAIEADRQFSFNRCLPVLRHYTSRNCIKILKDYLFCSFQFLLNFSESSPLEVPTSQEQNF